MMIVFVLCFFIFYNLIVNFFFIGDDDVKFFFVCLEFFWYWFDFSIFVQYVQDFILCVFCVIQGFNIGYFEMFKDIFVFYIIYVVYDYLLVNFIMSFYIIGNLDIYVVICIRLLKCLFLILIRLWYILVKCLI